MYYSTIFGISTCTCPSIDMSLFTDLTYYQIAGVAMLLFVNFMVTLFGSHMFRVIPINYCCDMYRLSYHITSYVYCSIQYVTIIAASLPLLLATQAIIAYLLKPRQVSECATASANTEITKELDKGKENSRKKKRCTAFTYKDKAQIGRHAAEHWNSSGLKKFRSSYQSTSYLQCHVSVCHAYID